MSIWLYKKIDKDDVNFDFSDEIVNIDDTIYVYFDDEINGGFKSNKKLSIKENGQYEIITLDQVLQIDIPYSIFYKTKTKDSMVKLTNKEVEFILGKNELTTLKSNIKDLFINYIDKVYISKKTNQPLSENHKKISTRINYLEKIIPELVNPENPINIFSIRDREEINKIKDRLSDSADLGEINNSRTYSGQLLQTIRIYLELFDTLDINEVQFNGEEVVNIDNTPIDEKSENINFKTFIKKIKQKDTVKMDEKWNNIEFIIGQPNTGKSYNFEESRLFDLKQKDHYKYIKIPVSGGIGNEYKGLQNTDLAITYDPIKEEVRFGEFLQVLMSAIVNPKVPHVVFLDDFHNQDISSLLSEYTPLFKSQQKAEIKSLTSDDIFKEDYENSDEFIKTWNDFIETHCSKDINEKEVSIVPITNRISGDSLKLIYPNNFYLLGAANFNENTLNIFADWEDRAVITYKDPINTFIPPSNETEFVDCCIELNKKLHQILKDKLIFDTEKYCFGMWKIIDSNGNAISDLGEQKKVVKFLFGMIKNALRFNNKNSWINKLGWELFVAMQTNEWFKNNIQMLNGNSENIDYEILHKFNIYEDEI
ncbi:hypothetical protein [Aliarcobacter butzleri]|uniref:hypothetical protein n=1 Tax=Aliarcobacter butzleri TaxID=28197 RepID=UPI0021B68805|nr:hypothetical protein [Aliarcobacter butzleri]MCT7642623.1 hypothetical protein [Aliarcobacter butzleri]